MLFISYTFEDLAKSKHAQKCIALQIILPLPNIPNLVNILKRRDQALNSTTLGANGTVVRERGRDHVGSWRQTKECSSTLGISMSVSS